MGSKSDQSLAETRNGRSKAGSRSMARMILSIGLMAGLATTLLAPLEARGQNAAKAAPPSPWSFRVSPYVWFAGMNGKVGVNSNLPSVDWGSYELAGNFSAAPAGFGR